MSSLFSSNSYLALFQHLPLALATYFVTLQIPHLNLQQREISEDLNVFAVPFQCVPIRLDCLDIFLVRPLKQAIDVPTNVRLQVISQPSPGVISKSFAQNQNFSSSELIFYCMSRRVSFHLTLSFQCNFTT